MDNDILYEDHSGLCEHCGGEMGLGRIGYYCSRLCRKNANVFRAYPLRWAAIGAAMLVIIACVLFPKLVRGETLTVGKETEGEAMFVACTSQSEAEKPLLAYLEAKNAGKDKPEAYMAGREATLKQLQDGVCQMEMGRVTVQEILWETTVETATGSVNASIIALFVNGKSYFSLFFNVEVRQSRDSI